MGREGSASAHSAMDPRNRVGLGTGACADSLEGAGPALPSHWQPALATPPASV